MIPGFQRRENMCSGITDSSQPGHCNFIKREERKLEEEDRVTM
jgi:hypothetical protein